MNIWQRLTNLLGGQISLLCVVLLSSAFTYVVEAQEIHGTLIIKMIEVPVRDELGEIIRVEYQPIGYDSHDLTAATPVFATTIRPELVGSGILHWEDSSIWTGGRVSFGRAFEITPVLVDALTGVVEKTLTLSNFSAINDAVEAILQGGPTRRTIGFTLPVRISAYGVNLEIGISKEITFDVTIPNGAVVNLSQPANINSLKIDSRGDLVCGGMLRTDSFFLNEGNFELSAGGHLVSQGELQSYGSFYLRGSVIEAQNEVGLSGVFVGGGTIVAQSLTGNAPISLGASTALSLVNPLGADQPVLVDKLLRILPGGALSGNWTNTGRLVITGGHLQGTLTNASTGEIEIANGVDAMVEVGAIDNFTPYEFTLNNAGTLRWSGAGRVHTYGGPVVRRVSIVNQAGALFEITGSGTFSEDVVYGGQARWEITNAGTLRKTGGTGVSLVGRQIQGGMPDFAVTNTGTVEVLSGTLDIAGAFGDNGLIQLSAPGQMKLNGVTVTLPVFVTQPLSLSAPLGTNLVLKAAADGNPSPRYQWRRNGGDINGATGDSLTLNNFLPENAGSYTLVATNGVGSISSAPAILSIAANFSTWQQSKFTADELADASISAPNAVYGPDGLSNLLKYALGLEPKQNVAIGLPSLSTVGSDWVYTYTRPADRTDLTYEVEVSTNLSTWTTTGIIHERIGEGTTETWQARYPLASAANVFFRLRVSN